MKLRGTLVLAVLAACVAPTGAHAAVNPVAQLSATARAEVASAEQALPADLRPRTTSVASSVDTDCFSTAYDHIDPDVNDRGKPTNPAWWARDRLNVFCAELRIRDQVSSPAYMGNLAVTGTALYLDNLAQQEQQGPGHIHGGVTSLVPGALAADPFRAAQTWANATGGAVLPVSFTSSDGAQLNGNVFMPPAGTPTLPDGRYPGVVITDGSVQAFQEMYYWAAEGLAQYGYEVMTYDVQGQGDSDLLPSACGLSSCPGVPYQQNYNFYQGAEDALNFFLSTPSQPYGASFNPGYVDLDASDVGIAGHSLGAAAVSWVGQCDARVKAIVAWDDLSAINMSQCAQNVTVPAADRAAQLHAPALASTNDYEFEASPTSGVPNPNGAGSVSTSEVSDPTSSLSLVLGGGGGDGDAGFIQLKDAGVDSQIVSIRNGTHLIYSYIPLVLPANEIGERVAFYYTLAWLDEYLRGGKDALLPTADTAFHRLTTLGRFDASADHNENTANPAASDIATGTGTYSSTEATQDPSSDGNVPIEIQGIPIQGALSFYYYSEYSIHDKAAKHDPLRQCNDMLGGCPARQPSTP